MPKTNASLTAQVVDAIPILGMAEHRAQPFHVRLLSQWHGENGKKPRWSNADLCTDDLCGYVASWYYDLCSSREWMTSKVVERGGSCCCASAAGNHLHI